MDPDKSIGASGISIPSWMKQKIGDRYDMDDSQAFSPPSQDDNFFYIRYPKTTSRPQAQTNYHKIEKYTEAQQQAESVASSAAFSTPTTSAVAASSSMSKPLVPQISVPLDLEFDPDVPPPNLGHRRGSKSLPASPMGSPKAGRKGNAALQNRYFTAAFSNPKNDAPGYSSWLVSSLLGPREHPLPGEQLAPISESPPSASAMPPPPPVSSHLAVREQGMRKVKSAAQLEEDSEAKEEVKGRLSLVEAVQKVPIFKPKPSELREMNFWSPTSM